ncbi:MAG: cache domain-containing protein [Thermodesulfobacteriota bacterium]
MKKILVVILLSVFGLGIGTISFAGEFGTKEEAEALVKKAISLIKSEGKEKAFAEINNPKGKFVDRDLYIFVYDLNGKCVAHGFNPKMIGKDLLEIKDADGRYFVKERIEIGKTKGKGWQDYKFTNPLSKKIELKSAYIEKIDDLIVGCGVYKR